MYVLPHVTPIVVICSQCGQVTRDYELKAGPAFKPVCRKCQEKAAQGKPAVGPSEYKERNDAS